MSHKTSSANKRLTLADFQKKQGNKKEQQTIEQLLGQVLGDCHDSKKHNSTIGSGSHSNEWV